MVDRLEVRTAAAKPFLSCLQGVRGVMAFWVVLHHTSTGPASGLFAIAKVGYVAVDVFFVLSGFVLMLNHQDDFKRHVLGDYSRFLLTRLWRTYPLYLSSVLIGVLTFFIVKGYAESGRQVLAATFMLEQWAFPTQVVNQPVWSLQFEWVGYLAFPALVAMVRRMSRKQAVVTLTVLVAGFGLIGSRNGLWAGTEGWPALWRMAAECSGGCFLLWVLKDILSGRAQTPAGLGDAVLTFGVLGLAGILVKGYPGWTLPFTILIVGGAALQGRWARRLLANPVSLYCGRISFPLYLVHALVIQVVVAIVGHPASLLGKVSSTALIFGLSIMLAHVMHVMVERPALRLRRGRTVRQVASPQGLAP